MNKATLYILLTLFGSFGVALRFSHSHEKMPIGCDEFGYLNMAKSIRGESTVDTIDKKYIKPLLDTLRISSITENEIAWMITPHAYHVIPQTDKIINQYPPGTSLLLSIFPIHFRQLVFPFVCVFLVCILTLIIITKSIEKDFKVFDLMFPVFIFLMMISAPFTTELSRINSVSPTFGLLFAAGLLLTKNPLAAAFLIGLSVNFRIANALMLFPVLLFLPLKSINELGNLNYNLKLFVKFGAIALISTAPLLIYNYIELGNPLASTYSSIDKAYNSGLELLTNFKYYFNFDQLWLRIHVIGAACIVLLYFSGKTSKYNMVSSVSFIILNYSFFILHAVKMDYYPYASALIILGFIGSQFLTIKLNMVYNLYFKSFFLVCIVSIFTVGCVRYIKKPHQSFEVSRQEFISLCEYDIVWGDLYSGTTEYVCNNSGFRYGTTTPRARKIALRFLKSNGYHQAILLDDNTIPENLIREEIEELGFKYHIKSNLTTGRILTID